MKFLVHTAALAALGYAAVIRRDQCCFQITASGDVSGVMGQLDDGQNRLNGTYSAATYCFSNGGITDANGRGCIVTTTNDATHQFQCDERTPAQAGFSVGMNGSLSFDNNNDFYACPYNNGDSIEYNVYTQELVGQDKCRPVKLSTGGMCAISASSCALATTAIYTAASMPLAGHYASTQSVLTHSSAFTAAIPMSSVPAAVSSVPELAPSIESSAPAYSSAPGSSVVNSTSGAIASTHDVAFSKSATSSNPIISVTAYSVPNEGLFSSRSSIAISTASASTAATALSMITSSAYEVSSTVPTTTGLASVCQTALTGSYETPHLIVPVSLSNPDTAYGTQYDAYIDSDNSTIMNFDIPASYEGMTCTTIFLFPELADLETSSYTFSGSGSVVFSDMLGVATEDTTYNTAPSVSSVLNTIAIEAGNSYVIASGSCAAGTTVSIELGSQNGLSLQFFEDWNPSSLGLYITAC